VSQIGAVSCLSGYNRQQRRRDRRWEPGLQRV